MGDGNHSLDNTPALRITDLFGRINTCALNEGEQAMIRRGPLAGVPPKPPPVAQVIACTGMQITLTKSGQSQNSTPIHVPRGWVCMVGYRKLMALGRRLGTCLGSPLVQKFLERWGGRGFSDSGSPKRIRPPTN